MIFIDELLPLKLYPNKKKFYAPFNEENKKKGALIYLLGKNHEESMKLLNNPAMINRKYFESYYTEKDIEYLIKNEAFNTVDDNYLVENYLHELTADDRNDLPDNLFGLPNQRKYPLHDSHHVKLAIKFFNHCPAEDQEELADNIKKAIDKFNLDDKIEVGKKNKFRKFLEQGPYILEKSSYSHKNEDDSEKEEAETLYNEFINGEQIKKEYSNDENNGINSVYLYDTFWPSLSKFIDSNKDNKYLLMYAKHKLSKYLDNSAIPEKYQKKAQLMSFVEKEIKKIDDYSSKIVDEDDDDDIEEGVILNLKYADLSCCGDRIGNIIYNKESHEISMFIDEDGKLHPYLGRYGTFENWCKYNGNMIINNDSILNESLKIDGENLYKNLEDFESGRSNILLVTGLTGSGKSTIAQKLASKYNAEWIETDIIEFIIRGNIDVNKAGEPFVSFMNSNKFKGEITNDKISEFNDKFLEYCFKWCKSQNNKKFIIEGLQIYEYYTYHKKIPQYPIVIKKVSALKSFIRKIDREKWTTKEILKNTPDVLKYMIKSEKDVKSLINSIDESSSKLSKNYQPNGKINLSSLRKIHITEDVINKYKKEYPMLSHVRCKDTKEYICDGYMWFDNNDLVAVVGSCQYTDDFTKWVVSLEILPKYKGYGLSKQVLNYAVKTMKCSYLSVNKNNEIAKKVYDDYGFKTFKKDNNMYYMSYGSVKQEEKISLTEARNDSVIMKKYLYQDRIRSQKEVILIYKSVKANNQIIKKTFTDINKYKGLNLFYDLNYYTEVFLNNIKLKNDRAITLYFEFLNKYINGKSIPSDYTKRTLMIPILDNDTPEVPLYARGRINPVAIIERFTRMGKLDIVKKAWAEYNIIFIGKNGYFKIDLNNFDKKNLPKFRDLVNKLSMNDIIDDIDLKPTSKSIANDTIEKIEKDKGIEIINITGKKSLTGQNVDTNSIMDRAKDNAKLGKGIPEEKEKLTADQKKKINVVKNKKEDISIKKKEIEKIKQSEADDDKDLLVTKIKDAANKSNSVEDNIKTLEEDPDLLAILSQLETQDNGNEIKMNVARTKRMETLKNTYYNKSIKGKKIKDIIEQQDSNPLEKTQLKVDSINQEWQDMSFMNFNKAYDLDKDLIDILNSFSNKSVPIGITELKVDNTSTSEDFIDTWTISCEDGTGQRFTLKLDIPRLKDNRFMRLRGNDKTINAQLMLLPIIKTDQDIVQIVSNYNKIFIKRFGTTGKSTNTVDKLIKTLNEMVENKSTEFTITLGDNSKICSKYELPIEYIDLASNFSKIDCKDFTIYFNQDELYEKYGDIIDSKRGIPYGYNKISKDILYMANEVNTPAETIRWTLGQSEVFEKIYLSKKNPTKANYSKASILNTEIPLVVVAAYSVGLQNVLKRADISYSISTKRPSADEMSISDYIRFEDGYLIYENNISASLLMNGLKECDTINHSLTEIDSKEMWLDFLDEFGGRIKADGLDNFYDLMIDPMTASVCRKYSLPDNYIDLLIYANELLEDNKYNRHSDITGNRYRTNELIAGYVYKSLAQSYGEYKNSIKRNRKGVKMTIKQSAVIDSLLVDCTESDLSISRPLSAIESGNTVSFKGLSGMNSDRSYGLDKRTYDDSMINVLALSTGFASTVGVVRQSTIDMNIESDRGYIKQQSDDDLSITKTFCMTEALTPFGTTHDDPFRSAMTFIQTAKHEMPIAKPMPSLITNGADEAVPYLAPSIFAVKAKENGRIIEMGNDIGHEYMIIQYKNGEKEFVNLAKNIFKNSDGGFYGDIKLDTDLKIGSTVKKNDIIAYDRTSFTREFGPNDNLSYEIGTLAKVAILATDENFEDSAMIDNYLSDALSSRVTVKIDKTFDKDTNIYNLVKKGTRVEEGDTLCIIQNSFDDADANALMKQLAGEEDEISSLGRINIKSKVTGTVEDIVIYRTVEIEELSPTLQKIVKDYEKPIKEQKKIMTKNGINDFSSLKPDYKLESTGKLKNVQDGILIEFYLSYEDKMSIGDKLVFYSANKGVIKNIFPEGKEPRTKFRPTEKINAFVGTTSINARMVTSIQHIAAINKIMIELDRKVKGIMGVEWKTLEEMKEI